MPSISPSQTSLQYTMGFAKNTVTTGGAGSEKVGDQRSRALRPSPRNSVLASYVPINDCQSQFQIAKKAKSKAQPEQKTATPQKRNAAKISTNLKKNKYKTKVKIDEGLRIGRVSLATRMTKQQRRKRRTADDEIRKKQLPKRNHKSRSATNHHHHHLSLLP